jgi:hypothetical protein
MPASVADRSTGSGFWTLRGARGRSEPFYEREAMKNLLIVIMLLIGTTQAAEKKLKPLKLKDVHKAISKYLKSDNNDIGRIKDRDDMLAYLSARRVVDKFELDHVRMKEGGKVQLEYKHKMVTNDVYISGNEVDTNHYLYVYIICDLQEAAKLKLKKKYKLDISLASVKMSGRHISAQTTLNLRQNITVEIVK